MKVRNGFVSNSSSSSFVIGLHYISADQLEKIKNHIEEGKKLNIDYAEQVEAWEIEVNKDFVQGYTFMDNFCMKEFLDKIGVLQEHISWGK